MKVAGLISGGKDSIFNLLCCKCMGHEIVVLANLTPSEVEIEIDSYMYQSVGRELLPLISECLEIPIIQRKITGKAINQEIKYKNTEGDEVEDLFELLLSIKNKYPEIEGVSCGAVMSNYQRIRLEDVAYRLDLCSLCFMWMLPEYMLLNSIINSNIKCIIVKIASFGLDEKYVGRLISDCLYSFKDIQEKLCSDFHCCGEGGEYETLTLDGPFILFKKKYISIKEYEKICLDSNPYAPVYVLKPIKYELKEKELLDKDDLLDNNTSVLPFLDNKNCLCYYLLDTGRYLLVNFDINDEYQVIENKSNKNRILSTIDELNIKLFDKKKCCIIRFTIKLCNLNENIKISDILSEKIFTKEWAFKSKAILFDVIINYSKSNKNNLPNYLYILNNIWKDINLDKINIKWNPTINIEYIENDDDLDNILFYININKCSNENSYKYIYEYNSSSITSYGTSIPRSFSNNIVVSRDGDYNPLNKFQFKDDSIKYPSIIISSSIYGIIPHLQLTPNEIQIAEFLKKINIDSRQVFNTQLFIELSLAVRSYRCNLNSLIYNSQLLAFKNEVRFRYDIFNITHIWIIEVIDQNISLKELSDYFKLLINKYNYDSDNYSSEWSSIHKFIQNSLYNSIDPIIIPISISYLPYNSQCKIIPISFLIKDYNNFTINRSDSLSKYWNYELRSISSEKQIVFILFNLNKDVDINDNNFDLILNDLKFIISFELNKCELSLEDNIFYSRFFILEDYYFIVEGHDDYLIQISSIIPTKKLCNLLKLQYLILISS